LTPILRGKARSTVNKKRFLIYFSAILFFRVGKMKIYLKNIVLILVPVTSITSAARLFSHRVICSIPSESKNVQWIKV